MKAIEQYFPVVLFAMLYKVVWTFESVVEILTHLKVMKVGAGVMVPQCICFLTSYIAVTGYT